jgi:hypothetical protein
MTRLTQGASTRMTCPRKGLTKVSLTWGRFDEAVSAETYE